VTLEGLTVVVPLFNGARFIGETLDSLAAQTLPVAEVIVVDDGSTDHGDAVVRSHDIAARLLRQDHAGVAVARNRGALAARTKWIAVLDQDDLWLPSRHARLRRFLDLHPSCQALVTTERSFYLAEDEADLVRLREPLHPGSDYPSVPSVKALLSVTAGDDGETPAELRVITTRELLGGPTCVTTSFVFARELLFAAGGFPPAARSHDDYLILLNVSRLTSLVAIDEPSVLYRIHPGATSTTTFWSLPLLTSLAAARFGGNLVPFGMARDADFVAPLSDDRGFWRHQLLGLVDNGPAGLGDALALVRLLGCGPAERRSLSYTLTRRAVAQGVRRLVAIRQGPRQLS